MRIPISVDEHSETPLCDPPCMLGAKNKNKRRPSGSGSNKIPLITLDLFLSGFVGREAYDELYFSNLNVEKLII